MALSDIWSSSGSDGSSGYSLCLPIMRPAWVSRHHTVLVMTDHLPQGDAVAMTPNPSDIPWRSLDLVSAATTDDDAVLAKLGSNAEGLSRQEAARRLQQVGPNALVSHGARPLSVLVSQLRNPLLILL